MHGSQKKRRSEQIVVIVNKARGMIYLSTLHSQINLTDLRKELDSGRKSRCTWFTTFHTEADSIMPHEKSEQKIKYKTVSLQNGIEEIYFSFTFGESGTEECRARQITMKWCHELKTFGNHGHRWRPPLKDAVYYSVTFRGRQRLAGCNTRLSPPPPPPAPEDQCCYTLTSLCPN